MTGELGVFFMLVWTSIFIDRVEYATIDIPDWQLHMLFYYINDGNFILDPLPPGSRLVDKKIVILEEFKQDQKSNRSVRQFPKF